MRTLALVVWGSGRPQLSAEGATCHFQQPHQGGWGSGVLSVQTGPFSLAQALLCWEQELVLPSGIRPEHQLPRGAMARMGAGGHFVGTKSHYRVYLETTKWPVAGDGVCGTCYGTWGQCCHPAMSPACNTKRTHKWSIREAHCLGQQVLPAAANTWEERDSLRGGTQPAFFFLSF